MAKTVSHNRVFSSLCISGFSTGIQTLLNIVGFLCIARTLPKDDFGTLIIITLITFFFSILSSIALEGLSATHALAQKNTQNHATIIGTSLVCKGIITVLLCIVLYFTFPLISLIFFQSSIKGVTGFVCIFFVVYSLDEFLRRILQAYHTFTGIAIAQISGSFLRLVLLVALAFAARIEIRTILLAYCLSYGLTVAFLFYMLPQKKFAFSLVCYRHLFTFGLPLGLNNILTSLYMKIDRMMIGYFSGPAHVASFEVASKIPDNGLLFYQSVKAVLFPTLTEMIAAKNYSGVNSLITTVFRLLSFVSMMAAMIVLFTAKPIIHVAFTDLYLDVSSAFILLFVVMHISMFGNLLGTLLLAGGYSKTPFYMSIALTILNISANILLIPHFGYKGAIYATLLANYGTHLGLSLRYLTKLPFSVPVFAYFIPLFFFIPPCVYVLSGGVTPVWLAILLLGVFIIANNGAGIIRKSDCIFLYSSIQKKFISRKKTP